MILDNNIAEQLVTDILEIEGEEEPLTPIEMDPVLLMTDTQIKKEVDQLPPAQKALFDDLKKFAEDQEGTGTCMPLDMLITTFVNTRYPRIPSAIAASIVKPEEGTEDLPAYQLEEGTSNKTLVTAIFLSTDPAVLNYNMKGTAAECTDEDYDSVHDVSDTEELDSTEIAQIWRDMAKLKRDEAALYDISIGGSTYDAE